MRTFIICSCAALVGLAAFGASAPAKTKKPPWAGKNFSGTSKLQTGQKIGTATLRASSDGKRVSFTIPWSCGGIRQVASKTVSVASNGTFKGGAKSRNGSGLEVSFFVDGGFVVGKKGPIARGDLDGAIRQFVVEDGEEGVADECETGNVAFPGIVWLAKP
jgi:hypothetical protein